jgi:2-keto-3-deoxy-L-fuconate dehydrogenase
MADRLNGKRVVVTDAEEFMGPDIVALFRQEGAEVIADTSDLRTPGRCATLIDEAGHVDVLMAIWQAERTASACLRPKMKPLM